MNNKVLTLGLAFLLMSACVMSQTYEEYVKQQQAEFRKFRDKQDQTLASMRREYAAYVKKRDQEYSVYLRSEWEKFQVFAGKKMPDKIKPKAVPEYQPRQQQPVRKIPAIIPRQEVPVPLLKLAYMPVISKPEQEDDKTVPLSFSFCGEKASLNIDPDLSRINLKVKGKTTITEYWDKASLTNYPVVIKGLKELQMRFNVNDYGYYMMVNEAAAALYPAETQNARRLLFTWFIMLRSGYDIRIAYNEKSLALLIPSYNQVFGRQYLVIDGMNFYFFTPFEGTEIMTYEKTYDKANIPMDFNIHSPMNFSAKPVARTVSFTFRDSTYNLSIDYNPSVIRFFSDYPQVDPEIYFNAAVSMNTKQSIDETFRPIIEKMQEPDAVNLLLGFVQKGFAYQTDPEQFGREKFFFAEEVFHYPAADCEDRSVLFAYLVRHLMALKMVGLESPEHMFTAVHFNADVFGDYLTYQGDSYIVADPTYINAPFGRTMPSVSLMDAKVIPLHNNENDEVKLQYAMEIARKAGIRKAGTMPNVTIDRSGDFFVTGYFSGTLHIETFTARGYIDAQSFITVRMAPDGKLLWADQIPCSGNATGLTVRQDPEGNVYVAGSFSGMFETLNAGSRSDLFILKYTPTGKRLWLRNGGLDTIPEGTGLIYSLGFSSEGKKEHLRVVEYSRDYSGYGLFADSATVVFNGSMFNTIVPATAHLALNAKNEMDNPALLKKEYDQFVQKQTDKAVAGLLAISNIIRTTGMVISGKDVQKAFDEYNPGFKTRCPNMYKLIGKVSFLKNSNNIITIFTENGDDVHFDKLKLSNKSQMRVSVLPDGNAQVDAISGIRVGKMVVWYPLNYVRIFSRSGDLLFDYDDDHSQVRMNLRKDILN